MAYNVYATIYNQTEFTLTPGEHNIEYGTIAGPIQEILPRLRGAFRINNSDDPSQGSSGYVAYNITIENVDDPIEIRVHFNVNNQYQTTASIVSSNTDHIKTTIQEPNPSDHPLYLNAVILPINISTIQPS